MIPSTMIKRMMKELISNSSEADGFIIGPFHNILGNRDSPLLFFFGPPVSANPGKLPGNSLHFDQPAFRSRGVHFLGGRLSL